MSAHEMTGGKLGEATGQMNDSPNLHGALEGGIRSRDRRHGDPFPLPRPKQFQLQTELEVAQKRVSILCACG